MNTTYTLSRKPAFSMLVVVLLFYSCGKDDEEAPDSMNLSGTVMLYTEDGLGIDDSGMTVTIQNSSKQAVSNENGTFAFSDLEFGNYVLEFNKEGYGEHKRFVNHPVSDSPNVIDEFIRLGQKSTAEMVSLDLTLNGDILSLLAVSEPEAVTSVPRYFHIFYHGASDVSFENFTTFETSEFTFSPSNYNKSTSFFYNAGFNSGEEIHIAVYTTSKYDNAY